LAAVAIGCTATSIAQAQDQSKPVRPAGDPGSWFHSDDYPPAARRAHAEGRVSVDLKIDALGRVTDCLVTSSSGSSDLDARTCELARSRGQFAPARDAEGQPIAGTYSLPGVRWSLPPAKPVELTDAPKTLVDMHVRLLLDDSGAIQSCRSLDAATPDQVACQNTPMGQRPFGAPMRAGKPSPTSVDVTTRIVMKARNPGEE
jgi:TonB family protein